MQLRHPRTSHAFRKNRTTNKARPLSVAVIPPSSTMPFAAKLGKGLRGILLFTNHASGWRGNVQRQPRSRFARNGQRVKPSNSSFAQAITCLIDWPSFIRAII